MGIQGSHTLVDQQKCNILTQLTVVARISITWVRMITLSHKADSTTDVLQDNDHKRGSNFLLNTKDVFSKEKQITH